MRKAMVLVAGLGLVCGPATVDAAPNTAHSPLLGRWAVEVARLPMPPEARPKSVTITFSQSATDKWRTVVDIVAPDGTVRHMAGVYQLGGAAAKIEGDQLEADTATIATPAPNVMVLAMAKDGRPASTRVYTVTPNGQRMTESAVSYDDTGTPIIRTFYFTRIRK